MHGPQSLNPLPYVAMAANCTLGSLYGQITHDAYIYFPNMIGLLLSECADTGKKRKREGAGDSLRQHSRAATAVRADAAAAEVGPTLVLRLLRVPV
jgi:hypothetical protein